MKNHLPTDNIQDAHRGRDGDNELDLKASLPMLANGLKGLKDGTTQCNKYSSRVVHWNGLVVRRIVVRLENTNPHRPHFDKASLLNELDGYFSAISGGSRKFYGGHDKVIAIEGEPRADEYTIYVSE